MKREPVTIIDIRGMPGANISNWVSRGRDTTITYTENPLKRTPEDLSDSLGIDKTFLSGSL
jgi:hypothetical protein